MPNVLVELMPQAVRDELNFAGTELSFNSGEAIPREFLGGGFVFIVEHGVASKFLRSDAGQYSEIGMVGREGMFPVCGLLGVAAAPHVVISQIGELRVRRVRGREFHAILGESAEAQLLIRKYVYAFLTQVSSNILTTEHDVVEQRIARWLLMCYDRSDSDTIAITHDTLAQMASAQRPTITNVLNGMRAKGMITLARGRIGIVSRPRLCRCADGSYGLSEGYWRDHIGPFGRDEVQQPRSAASAVA